MEPSSTSKIWARSEKSCEEIYTRLWSKSFHRTFITSKLPETTAAFLVSVPTARNLSHLPPSRAFHYGHSPPGFWPFVATNLLFFRLHRLCHHTTWAPFTIHNILIRSVKPGTEMLSPSAVPSSRDMLCFSIAAVAQKYHRKAPPNNSLGQ